MWLLWILNQILFLHEQWLNHAGYTSPWVIMFTVIQGFYCSNWTVTSYFHCWLHPWNKLFKSYPLFYQLLPQASKTWNNTHPCTFKLIFQVGNHFCFKPEEEAAEYRLHFVLCTHYITELDGLSVREAVDLRLVKQHCLRLHTGPCQKCRNSTGSILCLSFVLQTMLFQ